MAFTQQNGPSNLSMVDVLAAAGRLGGYARSCRFAVTIKPMNATSSRLPENDLIYMCDSAEFPGRGFGVTDVRYYGPSLSLPNNTEYQPASFSFLCRVNSRERQFFDDYMEIINPTNTFNFEYAQNYWSEIRIYQLGETPAIPGRTAPGVAYSWRLLKAWPILVSPQQVTWADSDVLRLQVSFSYKYWDRPDLQR